MAEECKRMKILRSKSFFEQVISRTEEILSQVHLLAVNATYEVLTHIELLQRTVRLPSQLANIVTNETDVA